jgi:tetratricopeptide (TPR) repeat protein
MVSQQLAQALPTRLNRKDRRIDVLGRLTTGERCADCPVAANAADTMTEKAETQPAEDSTRLVSLDTGIGGMPFGRDEVLTAEQARLKEEALQYFKQAYTAQFDNDLDKAASLYQKSIECYPTAEAHTFLGWTYSFMGMTDDAITECERAIDVDPEFGNPYNDIGAYLIEKGDLIGAIPWLERAARAERYQCYFYPHFNLGRVYQARDMPFRALREYKEAIDLYPSYKLAVRAFRRLQSKLN